MLWAAEVCVAPSTALEGTALNTAFETVRAACCAEAGAAADRVAHTPAAVASWASADGTYSSSTAPRGFAQATTYCASSFGTKADNPRCATGPPRLYARAAAHVPCSILTPHAATHTA